MHGRGSKIVARPERELYMYLNVDHVAMSGRDVAVERESDFN